MNRPLTTALVLHPSLRSHWFGATEEGPVAQKVAIERAEAVFRYVAETYLETSTPPPPAVAPKTIPKPPSRMPSFLASACLFQRPATATSATTVSKRTPQEELADELDRYFRFEAAPMEQPERGEPSAHEVLLNPLLWWKVSTFVTTHACTNNLRCLDPCR